MIGFELQAHGRTADIDRPLSMEAMADDVAAALPKLGVEKADDLVRPEHAVEWFRLLGGGVFGDMPPVCRIPSSRSCRERRMSPSSIALSYWCQ